MSFKWYFRVRLINGEYKSNWIFADNIGQCLHIIGDTYPNLTAVEILSSEKQ